jgi:hypothetical protein
MQRWEYMRVVRTIPDSGKAQWTIKGQPVAISSFDDVLNQMGADGWELVGVSAVFTAGAGGWGRDGGHIDEYVFKRPKP